jgi:hypothetical protein
VTSNLCNLPFPNIDQMIEEVRALSWESFRLPRCPFHLHPDLRLRFLAAVFTVALEADFLDSYCWLAFERLVDGVRGVVGLVAAVGSRTGIGVSIKLEFPLEIVCLCPEFPWPLQLRLRSPPTRSYCPHPLPCLPHCQSAPLRPYDWPSPH